LLKTHLYIVNKYIWFVRNEVLKELELIILFYEIYQSFIEVKEIICPFTKIHARRKMPNNFYSLLFLSYIKGFILFTLCLTIF
jgi:hypothetical protein